MENNNDLNIFNGPLPTSEEGQKLAQEMEQKSEEIIETPAVESINNAGQFENPIIEEPNSVEQPKNPIIEESNNVGQPGNSNIEEQIITSGTATEEEIEIDATKVPDEILDEEEIKKDVKEENKKTSKNIWFIIITIAIIAGFIISLPYIMKMIGM